jgi:hypothetical protein
MFHSHVHEPLILFSPLTAFSLMLSFPLCYVHTELDKKQVCLGICALDFESVLHFSDTDYDVITEQGGGVQVGVSTKFTIKTTMRSLIV